MNFKQQAMVFIIISPAIWFVFFISLNPEYKLAMVSKDTYYNITTVTPPIPPQLVQISKTIWVYSAFLENTLYSDNVTVVTVFSVADDAIKKLPIECRIDVGRGKGVVAPVSVSKIEDKYPLKYDLWKVSCKANAVLSARPVGVTISVNHSAPVTVPVLGEHEYVGEIGCCLAGPLRRGDKGVMDLISWVEFQRLLGVDSIFVYAMSFTVEVREVLEFYVREGVVEVIEWNFPISNRDFRYFGQNLLINDCLYRSRDLFKYTIFIDLDETIVPIIHGNLIDLLTNQTESKVSGFGFHNRFHHTHWRLPHSSLQSLYPSLARIPDIKQAVLTHKVNTHKNIKST